MLSGINISERIQKEMPQALVSYFDWYKINTPSKRISAYNILLYYLRPSYSSREYKEISIFLSLFRATLSVCLFSGNKRY